MYTHNSKYFFLEFIEQVSLIKFVIIVSCVWVVYCIACKNTNSCDINKNFVEFSKKANIMKLPH